MSSKSNRYRTPLKNVRGWGSAKTGTEHFIHQRLTAAALVLLGLWFVWFVISLVGSDYASAVQAVSRPWNVIALVGFLSAMFWHAQLGCRSCSKTTSTIRCSRWSCRPA